MSATQVTRRLDAAWQESLRKEIRGVVVCAEDDCYDVDRMVFNAMHDRSPAAIVKCLGTSDIVAVLAVAREHDLPVAVRGGGHSPRGLGTVEAGVVVDLSLMRGVVANPERGTVSVQGGALLGDLDREAQAYGVAVPSGAVSNTGIGGLTLGGGIGYLMRRFGLTCDNLLSAQMITADGRVLDVREGTHPDLLWALRGGGGGFGVVSSFEFQANRIPRQMFGGVCSHPIEDVRKVLEFYRDYSLTAPRELGLNFIILKVPDFDGVYPEIRGRTVVSINLNWSGESRSEGEKVVAAVRKFGSPVLDTIRPKPYTTLQSQSDIFSPHGLRYYMRSGFVPEMSDEMIDATAVLPSPPDFSTACFVEFLRLGGAVKDASPDFAAFGHGYRNADFYYGVVPVWDDETDNEEAFAWTRDVTARLEPFTYGTYVNTNFQADGEPPPTVRTAVEEDQLTRLAAVKAKYDPANVFSKHTGVAQHAHAA